ncbi:NusG domain II-containing protein [uncultured Clostridium sp.]|uniref:NusG domain II-containing protein n=1 Tax=uncultured Clostridium sp. TaxID=59620 RepID=UPI00262F65F4|nr:NusG domain II-containing protein [uncultured Clostridium sp.]
MKAIKILKKLDLIVIICLFLTSLIPFFVVKASPINEVKRKFINIKVSGTVLETLPLSENRTFDIETSHGINTIKLQNGIVSMIDADCKDSICINTKGISKVYESIICLPHEVIIEIKGEIENQSDDDMIFSH